MRWLLPALAGATSELREDPGEGLQGGSHRPGGVQRSWLPTSPCASTCWQVGHTQQSRPTCRVLACHALFLFFLAAVPGRLLAAAEVRVSQQQLLLLGCIGQQHQQLVEDLLEVLPSRSRQLL